MLRHPHQAYLADAGFWYRCTEEPVLPYSGQLLPGKVGEILSARLVCFIRLADWNAGFVHENSFSDSANPTRIRSPATTHKR